MSFKNNRFQNASCLSWQKEVKTLAYTTGWALYVRSFGSESEKGKQIWKTMGIKENFKNLLYKYRFRNISTAFEIF